jgi:dipeptidyl aminopeptidase/acylaminoacyl peptidase
MKKLTFCLGLAAGLATTALAQPAAKFSLDKYLDYETVTDPRLAPNGRQVVYARQWIDKVNDRRITDTWIMEADGSRQRFLFRGSSARFSPDGNRLAYLAEGEPKGTQLFVKYLDAEGPATPITRVERAPNHLAWSPNGQWLAFSMRVPQKETWPVKLPKPEGAKWTEEPRFVDDLVYRRDRVGFVEDGYVHVFVVPATGGAPRQVTSGDWDHAEGGLSWTSDGQEILFTSLRVPEADYQYRESEVYAANVASGQIRQLTQRKGPDNNPLPSPDGKLVAYTGYDYNEESYTDSRLYVMNADGSQPRDLTGNFDRSPQAMWWAADGSGLYFTCEDNGSLNLHFASLKGGVKAITTGAHLLGVGEVAANGTVVATLTRPQAPSEVVSFRLAKGKDGAPQPLASLPAPLTQVNDDILAGVKLGAVEELRCKSVDDFNIQGWVVKPPDFDPAKKYPLLLVIHGGPHAMYNVGFNPTWQLHAAEGYVVLYTNPRGSTGYGSAFANAIKNDYPNKDYTDLMNSVDEVIKKGYIDDQRLFVYGGSGGGVLTSWIVGHTTRFAAASVNFPVINWLSFVGTTDGVGWYRNFKKLPWEDPSEHLRRSPLMYVGNVKTPTMLMCGVNDLRTPISQTEEFYQALKLRKVPTVMIRFNDEYHGTSSKPSNFCRTVQYLHYWFKQHDGRASK